MNMNCVYIGAGAKSSYFTDSLIPEEKNIILDRNVFPFLLQYHNAW